MDISLGTLLIYVFFLASPLVYFFIMQTNPSVLYTAQLIYPFFFLLAVCFSYFIDRKRHILQNQTKHVLHKIAVIGIVLYALYLFLITWYLYANFISQATDLEYFHQTIWQLSEFKIPYIWILNQPVITVWAQHFSPILIFLVPFFWISHSAGLLLMEQALAVVSGAIPIYFIAKRFLHSRGLGLALAFAYLSFGGLQFGMQYGFHEIMFFPSIFLWAYYFYLSKKTKLYVLFILLSLFVKEEVAFIVLFWGVYLLIFRRDKIWGTATTGLGILWYFVCFNIVFPHFNKGGFVYWGQYSQGGGSGLQGMIQAIIAKPLTFLQTLVTPSLKVEMMLDTFGQFSFLFLLFPPALLIIFPSLMEKLLSDGVAMGNGAHYSAAICAVTVVATFEALPHIYKYKFVNRFIHNKNIFFIVLIFYSAFFSNIFYSFPDYSLIPFHPNYMLDYSITPDNESLLTQILNTIPNNATVSSNAPISPHLNKYYKFTTPWPGMVGTEDFVIIDTQLHPAAGSTGKEYNDALDKLSKNKNYQLAVSNLGILVFRKKSFNLNNAQ